jgi:hypothetical protein
MFHKTKWLVERELISARPQAGHHVGSRQPSAALVLERRRDPGPDVVQSCVISESVMLALFG